jgi:iron complex transport system ATP-binding protein
MSIVEVDRLTVRAGSKVLVSNVSLSIEAGTWCTVIGPNGAGKTTLVETVAGIRKSGEGSVSISGRSLAEMNERERAQVVSLVPQHPEIPAGMTVKEYVALGRSAYHGLLRAPSPHDRAIVDSVFERLSLQEFADRDVATLSGGERQRMVLGRALAQSTGVIVLDEPITGLDVRHQMELLELLKFQVEDGGLTVLATMHDLTLAGQFADRLVLLDKGEVALDGPAGEVVRSDELARCYGIRLRVVDVDGADVVVPVRTKGDERKDQSPDLH